MGEASGPGVEVVLVPGTDRFDPEDDRWREQVAVFMAELQREVGGVRRAFTPVEGTKGAVDTVILALGSAGAFTAAVELFRSWLGRARDRRLDISWTQDGHKETISLAGNSFDEETLGKLAEAVLARTGTA
ncbi:MAG: effector-associated constant component EACC1 [Acidimicrobiales bacterium]